MADNQHYLQVVCRVTADGAWLTQWDGNTGLAPTLLGVLEYAKHQAIGEMDREADKPVRKASRKARRSDAMNFYIDLRQKIEQRLQAIAVSDEQAEFELPTGEI